MEQLSLFPTPEIRHIGMTLSSLSADDIEKLKNVAKEAAYHSLLYDPYPLRPEQRLERVMHYLNDKVESCEMYTLHLSGELIGFAAICGGFMYDSRLETGPYVEIAFLSPKHCEHEQDVKERLEKIVKEMD